MLGWALSFLVIALVAGVLGFGGIAGIATGVAKGLFFLFLAACAVALLLGRRARAPASRGRRKTPIETRIE